MKKMRKAIAQAETKPMVAPRAVKNPLMNSVMIILFVNLLTLCHFEWVSMVARPRFSRCGMMSVNVIPIPLI